MAGRDPGRLATHIREIRRSVDYLQAREDIDAERLAYCGTSWGAYMGLAVLAAEPRFKAGILVSGGFASYQGIFGFARWVTVPVQMVNGRQDPIFDYETSQLPMFRALGTPEQHKRLVALQCPHNCSPYLPEAQKMVRANVDFLDTYLGPVRSR